MDVFIIIIVLVLGFGVLAYLITKTKNPKEDLLEYLKTTNTRLNAQNTSFNQRLDHATKVIGEVQRNLGEMTQIGQGIKNLQEFLQSPKLRGGLGEEVLKDMIGETFPKNSFHLQYSFKSGVKVDAVLKTGYKYK